MGSISNLPGGLAYLTQPGGLLSNLSSVISTSELQSASPEDLVSLSLAALQAQQTDGLFGVTPANPGTAEGLAAIASDTPQQKTEISNQAVLDQQVQALFDPPTATSPGFNLIA